MEQYRISIGISQAQWETLSLALACRINQLQTRIQETRKLGLENNEFDLSEKEITELLLVKFRDAFLKAYSRHEVIEDGV